MRVAFEALIKEYGMDGTNCPECKAPFFFPTGMLKVIREFELGEEERQAFLTRTGPIEGYAAEFKCGNCGFITVIYPPVFKEQVGCMDFALLDKC